MNGEGNLEIKCKEFIHQLVFDWSIFSLATTKMSNKKPATSANSKQDTTTENDKPAKVKSTKLSATEANSLELTRWLKL
jgi:hypothetical protein